MNREGFQNRLIAFISNKLVEPHIAVSVEPDTLLFEEGLIDSMRILDLIAFVEGALSIQIPDHRVTLKNFHSAGAITKAFVEEATVEKGRL